jgi:hypothetical protein
MADSTHARVPAAHGEDHHRGFNDALEQALTQLSKDVGTGQYAVDVHFHAEVDVSNPGNVGFYAVTLTRA